MHVGKYYEHLFFVSTIDPLSADCRGYIIFRVRSTFIWIVAFVLWDGNDMYDVMGVD
jgi:hypothetical protein